MLTTEQFKSRTKTVTRRLGWWFLKPGDIVCGVEKGQGLKKGEKVKRLGLIRIKSTRPEPLNDITREDVIREGFSGLTRMEFIVMFCQHNKCRMNTLVNRIEFEYLDRGEGGGRENTKIK